MQQAHTSQALLTLSPALSTFLAIHHGGSISAASHELHLSQPAVSRRLQTLERQLGVALFDRVHGGLRLSSAGHALLPHAERAIAAERDAINVVVEHRDHTGGSVSIGIVGSLIEPWFADALRSSIEIHPAIDLVVSTATSRQIRDQVLRGDLTLGISYAQPTERDLEKRTLFAEELQIVCHPAHRYAGRRVRGLEQLRDERWLVFPRPDTHPESAGTIARRLLERHHVPDHQLRPIDSLTAQRALVSAGYGLAFLPRSTVAADLDAGTLAPIHVSGAEIVSPVTLLVRRDAYLSPAAITLIDLLGHEPS